MSKSFLVIALLAGTLSSAAFAGPVTMQKGNIAHTTIGNIVGRMDSGVTCFEIA